MVIILRWLLIVFVGFRLRLSSSFGSSSLVVFVVGVSSSLVIRLSRWFALFVLVFRRLEYSYLARILWWFFRFGVYSPLVLVMGLLLWCGFSLVRILRWSLLLCCGRSSVGLSSSSLIIRPRLLFFLFIFVGVLLHRPYYSMVVLRRWFVFQFLIMLRRSLIMVLRRWCFGASPSSVVCRRLWFVGCCYYSSVVAFVFGILRRWLVFLCG